MNKDRGFLKNLVLITQVGLTVLVPIALLTVLGIFLRDRFQANWILIVLIVLGIVSGMAAGWSLLKKFAPDPKDDAPREEYDLMKNWKADGKQGKPDDPDGDSFL